MKNLQAGDMRTYVEYGDVSPVFSAETGGVEMTWQRKGAFWAEKRAASAWQQGNLAATVDGVEISDDISTLRTWTGHDIKTDMQLRINGTPYSILSVERSNDDRVMILRIVSGLRDTKG